MPRIWHIDFETRSKADLPKCGAYRYAADPSARILLVGVSVDGCAPIVYDATKPLPATCVLKNIQPDDLLYAHNAQFERAVAHYRWEKDLGLPCPSPWQWRCTAVLARKVGLSPQLGTLSSQLQLTTPKDAQGKRLIQLFSLPPFADPAEHPIDWQMFIDYCAQDVSAEMEVHRKLSFAELSPFELEAFQLDARVNHRGFPVNVPALLQAEALVARGSDAQEAAFDLLTDGISLTQRDAFLSWLQERGYPYDDLQAPTRAKALDDTGWDHSEAVNALALYDDSSFAALKKIDSMLAWETDGYVKGSHYFFGAGTGRWSSKGVQIQNAKRATKRSPDTYARVCAGEMVTLEELSEAIRHFVQPHDGGSFLDVDFANIEARVLVWLAGQDSVLRLFAAGEDVYVDMARKIFRRKEITPAERSVGKVAVLGLGYGMGVTKFVETCDKFSIPVSRKLADDAVAAYRQANDRVVQFWRDLEEGVRGDADMPEGLQKREFCTAGINFLALRLRSGRYILYPHFDQRTMTYFAADHFAGRNYNRAGGWDGRKSLYGGLLAENIVQATAFDLLAHGAIEAERQGFEICALIHDQVLAEAHPSQLEKLIGALTTLPGWASGLPLEADGKATPYYTK
ncbi:MAG: DNA polymerase [Ilumatobacteraceae bacterium]